MSSNFFASINGQFVDLATIPQNQTLQTITMSTNDPTNNQYSMNFKRQVAIKTNDIKVAMNGYCLNGSQTYTFGPAQQGLYLFAGTGTNTLGFCNSINNPPYGMYPTSAYFSIVFNGKIWVATGVGGPGTFAYSYNGINWTNAPNTLNIFKYGYSIAWNGTIFLAGGQPNSGGNSIAYSYDGINWTGIGLPICGNVCNTVAWNGNMWLAGGATGTSSTPEIGYSKDGINWTTSSSSLSSIFSPAGYVYSIVWNGLVWLAVGSSSTNNGIGYSYNGVNWTSVTQTIHNGYSFITHAWNGKIWTIVSSRSANLLGYTTDPLGQTNWTGLGTSTFTTAIKYIKWTGKYFIAACIPTLGNLYAYSTTGNIWTSVTNFTGINSCYTLEYNTVRPHSVTFPRFMVVAGGDASANSMAYSYDGLNWTGLGTSIFSSYCFWVQYNGKIWVAGGKGTTNTLAYSYDGITWVGLGKSIFSNNSSAGCWNGTIWVAGGGGGGSWNSAYSYDGILWIPTLALDTLFDATVGIKCIVWDGSMFVAGGQGKTPNSMLAYSYDGINWTAGNNTSIFDISWGVVSISYNGTLFVAGGSGSGSGSSSGIIAYSYDGFNWTDIGTPLFNTRCYNIVWNGKMFLASGNGNITAYSYNGINWVGLGNVPAFGAAYGIGWDGTRWHIGRSGASQSAYSYNGFNWTTYTNVFGTDGGRCFGSNYGVLPIPYIQHPTIAVGTGTNTIAYSDDGIVWLGLGKTIFTNEGYDVFWNGQIWVAVGNGTNSIAYSIDGIQWTGLGLSVFSTCGNAVTWNGTLWVATGQGTNTLAYSKNGTTWIGLGTTIFSVQGFGISWNGTAFVAMGQGSNTIAYSSNGINWTGIGTTFFTTSGYDVATNGVYWVATGQGTNTLAYTTVRNGSSGWTSVGSIFSTAGNGICWNGSTWVAVGQGANAIAYSTNATTWTGSNASTSTFTTAGFGVCWNGVRFVATGQGGNSIAYSQDGNVWYPAYNGYSTSSTTQLFTTYGNCVASNPGVGAPTVQSQMILNNKGSVGTYTLQINSPPYYQQGFNEVSFKVEQNNVY
jgi:hypothetical protein